MNNLSPGAQGVSAGQQYEQDSPERAAQPTSATRPPLWRPHIRTFAKADTGDSAQSTQLEQCLEHICHDWLDFQERSIRKTTPRRSLTISLIGKGSFSCIYAHNNYPTIAWKISKGSYDTDYKNVARYMELASHEAEQYKLVGPHENIAKLLCVAELELSPGEHQLGLGMERYTMNLHEYLQEKDAVSRFNLSSEYVIRKCLYDVSKGISYLHQQNIIHRDIKTNNILLLFRNNDVCGKIADFGFVTKTTTQKPELVGTWCILAPEIMKYQLDHVYRKYTKKTDIWAFGILLMETALYPKALLYLADTVVEENKRFLKTLTVTQFHQALADYKTEGDDLSLKFTISSLFSSFNNFMNQKLYPSRIKLKKFSWKMQLLVCAAACMRKHPRLRLPLGYFQFLQDDWLKNNKKTNR